MEFHQHLWHQKKTRIAGLKWLNGQTDGRTDGIAVANTALAMRALRAL